LVNREARHEIFDWHSNGCSIWIDRGFEAHMDFILTKHINVVVEVGILHIFHRFLDSSEIHGYLSIISESELIDEPRVFARKRIALFADWWFLKEFMANPKNVISSKLLSSLGVENLPDIICHFLVKISFVLRILKDFKLEESGWNFVLCFIIGEDCWLLTHGDVFNYLRLNYKNDDQFAI
jgi:hypothetical protein